MQKQESFSEQLQEVKDTITGEGLVRKKSDGAFVEDIMLVALLDTMRSSVRYSGDLETFLENPEIEKMCSDFKIDVSASTSSLETSIKIENAKGSRKFMHLRH